MPNAFSTDVRKVSAIEPRIEGSKSSEDPRRPKPSLIAIVGPTAVGKSALAHELAEYLGSHVGVAGEIVSADSRQVYRTLDIGTAKPTPAEQRRVRHHLIDLVNPAEDFTVAEYQDRAHLAIEAVWNRGATPILVGGTGLYVRAVTEGIDFPRVPPDPELRARLEEIARVKGREALFRELLLVDPVAAARIHPGNIRRVVRALEVVEKSGRPFSEKARPRPRYNLLRIGLTMNREQLYQLIDARVDRQIAAGLVDETRQALNAGCAPTRPALSGFGYRQAVQYLTGELDLAEAVQRYKFETHRFVRQQYSWFRLADPSIRWIESGTRSLPAVIDAVEAFVGRLPLSM